MSAPDNGRSDISPGSTTQPGSWRENAPPSDKMTLAILCVTGLLMAGGAIRDRELLPLLARHLAIIAGFGATSYWMVRREGRTWVPICRGILTIAVMFALYGTLGQAVFRSVPWLADGALVRIDRALLLGGDPDSWMQTRLTPRTAEFFSFIYAVLLPYLYLSIVLGLVGRPALERQKFATGLVITYSLCFVGYMLIPAKGPIADLTGVCEAHLQGGYFRQLITKGLEASGGPHGAFPSLHIGATAFLCAFDIRYNTLRGLTYLPLIVLLAIATVVVRYHYVIDLVAGLGVAIVASWAASLWCDAWESKRRGVGESTAAQEAGL